MGEESRDGKSRRVGASVLLALALLMGIALAWMVYVDRWVALAPMPSPLFESASAVVDGKIYVFGGFINYDLHLDDPVYVYDPQENSWSERGDMPVKVSHLNAVVLGRDVWMAGGFVGNHPGPATDAVWRYDTLADVWHPGPPLPEARGGGGLAYLDGYLHYVGGFTADRNGTPGQHWILKVAGGMKWQSAPPLPVGVGHVSIIVMDGFIYALGGQFRHDRKPKDMGYCFRYDKATQAWESIASLPSPLSHFEPGTIQHEGKIYIYGGRNNRIKGEKKYQRDILMYDSKGDEWSVVGSLPEVILAPVAKWVGGRVILVGGGLNDARHPRAEAYGGGLRAGLFSAYLRRLRPESAPQPSIQDGPL